MKFFICIPVLENLAFPFPKIGNGIFDSHSHSRDLRMKFAILIPVPEVKDLWLLRVIPTWWTSAFNKCVIQISNFRRVHGGLVRLKRSWTRLHFARSHWPRYWRGDQRQHIMIIINSSSRHRKQFAPSLEKAGGLLRWILSELYYVNFLHSGFFQSCIMSIF